MQEATDKFISRFETMEEKIKKEGKDISRLTLEEMDRFWDKAKRKKQPVNAPKHRMISHSTGQI